MMEFLIGGIVGYLLGQSGSDTVYSTSYQVKNRYIGVVYYNTRTGKLIYFCADCGGIGKREYHDSSVPYTGRCGTCGGAKVLQMVVPKEVRKEIIEKVKKEKKRRQYEKYKREYHDSSMPSTGRCRACSDAT